MAKREPSEDLPLFKQVYDTVVPRPWIARQTFDTSWNVFGGERGLEFVACTGFGEAAKVHAQQIAAPTTGGTQDG